MATWNKNSLILDNGSNVIAQSPVIISASRSTDIPAFYSDWFLHRLKKGYSAWINPFNGVKSYVSYSDVRFIVFWSKNPRPLIESGLLDYLQERNIKCYIQYTLNDYEQECLETGVKPLLYRIDTFKMLVDQLGKGHVIWRFDPLILTDMINEANLLEKIRKIGEELKGYTEKLVFSFADIIGYSKVRRNLEASGVNYSEWDEYRMRNFAKCLSTLNISEKFNMKLATCAEKIDLSEFNIEQNKCIDGDLIVRLAWKDKKLMEFMKVNVCEVEDTLFSKPNIPVDAIKLDDSHYYFKTHKKDSGQREFCGCMAAKDIGEYNTCIHLCEYCYANTSKRIACENYKVHLKNIYSDTITGR